MNDATALLLGLVGPVSWTLNGETLSTVQVTVLLSPITPLASWDCTVTVCRPSLSGPGTGNGLLHGTAAALSRLHQCRNAVGSSLVKEITASLDRVGEGTASMLGAPGIDVSTSQLYTAEPGR